MGDAQHNRRILFFDLEDGGPPGSRPDARRSTDEKFFKFQGIGKSALPAEFCGAVSPGRVPPGETAHYTERSV